MTGPTFSPDGKWMWNGSEWIPAPPPSEVLSTENIVRTEIESVAIDLGVDPESLMEVAPYFDENIDGQLQQKEINQAATSLVNQPTAEPPENNATEAITLQQPMPQPAPPAAINQQPMPQPAPPPAINQQPMPQPAPPPAINQQPMPQPAPLQAKHQQQMLQQPLGMGIDLENLNNKSRLKFLVAGLVFLLISSTVLVIYFKEADFSPEANNPIGLNQIADNSINSGREFGASEGTNDVIASLSFVGRGSFDDQSFLSVEVSIRVNGGSPIYCSLFEGQFGFPSDCRVIWYVRSIGIPTYSGESIYQSQQTLVQDGSAIQGTIDQNEDFCRTVSGYTLSDHAFCDDSFIIMENGVDIVNSQSTIFIDFEMPGSKEQNTVQSYLPLLDYDADGLDDFVDECPLEFGYPSVNGCADADYDGVADKNDTCPMTSSGQEVDEDGCSPDQMDQDKDGILDDEDLLPGGNAGLRIYVSQLHIMEGEVYENDQLWPCKDRSGQIPYSYINDGYNDCPDESDEDAAAGVEGVNWRLPDFTYRLKVDWDCDEIYDDTIDISNNNYYEDSNYLNLSLDFATQYERVLNNDIPDDLNEVCVAINVFDKDIAAGELEPLDVTQIEGTGQSVTIGIGMEAFDGDFTLTIQGSDNDDSTNDNADALVSIRFLIYEI